MRRKENRPAELLAAALELFVARGFAATRLDDVAARAGVSKGTLYLYYPSKVELFKAVVRETIVPVIHGYQRDLGQSNARCDDLLRGFFREAWRRFSADRTSGIVKLVVAEARNFPEVARFFDDEVVRPSMELLATVARRGIERGEFQPIDVEAAVRIWMAPLVLKAIWMHSVESVCCGVAPPDPQRMIDTHLSMVLTALAPAAREPAENRR